MTEEKHHRTVVTQSIIAFLAFSCCSPLVGHIYLYGIFLGFYNQFPDGRIEIESWGHLISVCEKEWKDMSGCEKVLKETDDLCNGSGESTWSSSEPLDVDSEECIKVKNKKLRKMPVTVDHPKDEVPKVFIVDRLARFDWLCENSTLIKEDDCEAINKDLTGLCITEGSILEASSKECLQLKADGLKAKPRKFVLDDPISISGLEPSVSILVFIALQQGMTLCAAVLFCVGCWGLLGAMCDSRILTAIFTCTAAVCAGIFAGFFVYVLGVLYAHGHFQFHKIDVPGFLAMLVLLIPIGFIACSVQNAMAGYSLFRIQQSQHYAKCPELHPITVVVQEKQPPGSDSTEGYGAV